jgi:malate dehydrogenase (oxaloacetate-decarboxylating)(NADP+)
MPTAKTSACCAPPRCARGRYRRADPDRPPHVIEVRSSATACASSPASISSLINPEDDPRYRDYVDLLIELAGRRGVIPEAARTMVRTNNTVIGALALKRGDADA